MSTCSDSSFELVSDPELIGNPGGSDVEENSSTVLTGVLNPENPEKVIESKLLQASLEFLCKKLEAEHPRLEEDPENLAETESGSSDSSSKIPGEIDSEGEPGTMSDVLESAATGNSFAEGVTPDPEPQLPEPTSNSVSELFGELDLDGIPAVLSSVRAPSSAESLILLSNNKAPNAERLIPGTSSDAETELFLARIRIKNLEKALADIRNTTSAKTTTSGLTVPVKKATPANSASTQKPKNAGASHSSSLRNSSAQRQESGMIWIFLLLVLYIFASIAWELFHSLPGDAKFREEVQAMRVEAEWIFKHGAQHVHQIRSNLTKISCLEDVPEKLMSKWKPDPSRVIGIDFSKEEDGVNKTIVMTGTPVFEARNDNKVMMKVVAEYEGKIVNSTEFIFNKGCVYISECGVLKIYIKDGDLYFSDKDSFQGLVYTIPAKDLL